MNHQQTIEQLLHYQSFIELTARERTRQLLDADSWRELAGPFERLYSPWLAAQGIVAQADDGVVVAKGRLAGQPVVVLAVEGGFQGGSMGEVGGAKLAGALEQAAADNRHGIPTAAVLLLETGGVRLQEANLGLAAIADIHAAIVDLGRYQPVIGVIAGPVGCFGGMSIAAGLCSYLVVTREARLGLNGPQVIEQEAGADEYDNRDRPFIWSLSGGEQRQHCDLADACLPDDCDTIRDQVQRYLAQGLPATPRHQRHDWYLQRLAAMDTTQQADASTARHFFLPERSA
ncbi:biotin-independent malonate decarboxylase subunit beta [Aquitalea denitrificans]|uniref:biotin-independent malonate decarboxylase subunit beta n=1 Tax=Aquitalea denitrificans TaxID=519081 RepID=UPI00135A120C|nr:biotin-independent malonate decarboxylase subunit beta [Aquitalea denitrificans]